MKNKEKFSTTFFLYTITFNTSFKNSLRQEVSSRSNVLRFVVPSWFIPESRINERLEILAGNSLEGEILGGGEGKILIRHRDGTLTNIIENYPVDGGAVTRITPTVINMA